MSNQNLSQQEEFSITEARILELIAQNPGTLGTPKKIALKLGMDPSHVEPALRSLKDKKKIAFRHLGELIYMST